MTDFLGDSGGFLSSKKPASGIEPLDLGLDKQAPLDLGIQVGETLDKPEPAGLLDMVDEGAKALDRGILKTPVGLMDFAATLGSSLAGTDLTQDKLYQAARGYEGVVDKNLASTGKLSPTTNAILEGLGQVGGQVGLAALTGGTSATAQMMRPVAGMAIAGMGTTQGIQDANESGASPEDVKTAAVFGSAIGLTEFAPVEKILGIADKAAPGIKGKIVDVLATGGLEGLQEWVQQGGTNLVAKLTYDDERKLSDGLEQSAQVGGATGIVAATIATLLGVKHMPKMPTSEAESDAITPEVIPPAALPTPTRRTVESAVDAQIIQGQLSDSSAIDPEVMPNLPSTQVRQGSVYDGSILTKIRDSYPEGSPRQQYALAYAEKKLRGNPNTAKTPDVIPLEEPSVPVDISTEDAELQTLKEMLADPKTTTEDRDFLQKRLDEIQGTQTIERRLNNKQRALVEDLVNKKDIEGLSKLIYHDDLTGLMNKRSWDEDVSTEEAKPVEQVPITTTEESLEIFEYEGNKYLKTGDASTPKFKYADGPKEGKLVRNAGTKMLQARLESAYFDKIRFGSNRMTAVEELVAETKPQTVQASKPFTKMGSVWISPVGDGRSIGIIKKGTSYVGYVGTPEEIQQDVADEIGSWPSLPKARKALGDGQEIEPTPKITKVELKNRLDALKQANKKTHDQRVAEFVDEYADPEDAEEFVSWEEMKDEEFAVDFYGDQYETRDGADIAKDIWTIMNDERGSLNPKSDPEIQAAKERLGGDVKKLVNWAKQAGQAFKYPTSPNDKPVDIDALWKQLAKTIQAQKTVPHPATYTKNFIPIFANILKATKAKNVLDIFGGTGKIGLVKNYGFKGTVIANEIEPVYNGKPVIQQMKQNHVDVPMIGDATDLTIEDNAIDIIITSPTYGNQMAAKRKPGSSQDSYQKSAGVLEERNSGGMYWGPQYEQLHHQAYEEAFRVIKPGGIIAINMKDFYRTPALPKGSTVAVVNSVVKTSDWHQQALQDAGFKTVKRFQVSAGKEQRKHATKRLNYEDIIIAQKPSGIDYSQEASHIKKLYERLNKYLKNERGSVDMSGAYGLAAELGKKIKALYQALKQAAVNIKKWGTARKKSQSVHDLSQEEQADAMVGKRFYMKTVSNAIKANMDDAVKPLYQRMVETNRIVPEYKKGSKILPVRQRAWIPQNMRPQLRRGAEDLKISGIAKQMRSPSNIFRNYFKTWANPSIDMSEAGMSFLTNLSNNQKWAKDIMSNIPDTSKEMQAALDKIYEGTRPLIDARDKQILKLGRLSEKIKLEKDPAKKKALVDSYKAAQKRVRIKTAKIQKELTTKFDSALPALAEAYSDVRITLQVLGELPEGIKISPEEIEIAAKIKEFFEQSGRDLQREGILILLSRGYMHRILPKVLNDPESQGFARDSKLPLNMKFLHQEEDGRIWYPSMHMILKSYIPMVERKIAYQPFLNRWTEAIDDMPSDLRQYMTDWLNSNIFRQPLSTVDKMLNNVVGFECIRLIGMSLSVGFRHFTKAADSLARYDVVTNTKAAAQVTKLMADKLAKGLGINIPENTDIALLKAFVNSAIMTKMIDETPNITTVGRNIRQVASLPVNIVETFDNGLTLFSTALSASSQNLSPEQASRIIWETMLAANFRGGHDQPLMYKDSKVRAAAMFQMTPHKLWEYRGSVLARAMNGETDLFGTPYKVILARYIMMFGLAEWLVRELFDSSIVDQALHTPYGTEWIEPVKGGYALKEPKATTSPIIDWAVQMHNKGVVKGTAKHFSYWGQATKTITNAKGKYNKNWYNNPWLQQAGIKKVHKSHRAVSRRR